MASPRYFVEGQWNFTCQYCGRTVKSGTGHKTWDGYRVCDWHTSTQNPLRFAHGVAQTDDLPWRRGKPPEIFIDRNLITLGQVSLRGAVGVPQVVMQKGLSGVAAAVSLHGPTPELVLALSGVSSAGSLGTVTPSVPASVGLAQIAGTGSVGAVGPVVTVGLSGVAATTAVGSLRSAVSAPLVQVAATGATGSMTAVAVSGASMTQVSSAVVAGTVAARIDNASHWHW
jgi:hypothetical protein